jgi:hypothetical protein
MPLSFIGIIVIVFCFCNPILASFHWINGSNIGVVGRILFNETGNRAIICRFVGLTFDEF